MKILFTIFIIIFIWLVNNATAQNFLEVKYSINDIKKQRDHFKNEKVKSVTVKTDYGEDVFSIDSEGKIINMKEKSSNLINVEYIYDLKGNLIKVEYRLAPDEFEYDINGNVIKLSGEENTRYYYYDSQNKLVKEKVESDIESCSFDNIVYKELLIVEKIYPCCEGNYAMIYVYEYSDSEQLLKLLSYTKNCSLGIEDLSTAEEYFYSGKSKLPYKMIKNNQEINFTYEYYE